MVTLLAASPGAAARHEPPDRLDALLASGAPVTIVGAGYTGADSSTSFFSDFFDPTLPSGILLTSGDGTPPTSNTEPGPIYGYTDITEGGSDADLVGVIQGVYPSYVSDAFDSVTLTFTFMVPAGTTSVRFNLVFGSEEYPEFADSFVDVAAVFVDGVNYALFNGDPAQPLSVLQTNIDAGNFIDNTGGALPIEYDGVSKALTIIAPLGEAVEGLHTIKIGIADTNDAVLDSGLFIGGLTTSQSGSGGIKIWLPGTDDPDALAGGDGDELSYLYLSDDSFEGNGGDDVAFGNQGGDTLCGGDGDDNLYGGQGDDWLCGDAGSDTLKGGVGHDTAYGGAGDDTLRTGEGDDFMDGEAGNDWLASAQGDDTFLGGDGDDTMTGGADDDILLGGAGNDRFVFAPGSGDDVILDFASGDLIDLVAFNLEGIGELDRSQVGNDVLIELPGGGSILLADTALASIGPEDFVLYLLI